MLQFRWYRRAVRMAAMASLAIPAIAAGQGIQAHIPVSTTLGDIAKVRAAYVDAINTHNAGAVTAMYTADAVVLGADGSQTVGARAIAKLNAESSASWAQSDIRSTSVKVFGATAIDVGTWSVRNAAGEETMRRYLAVLRHEVNGWRFQSIAMVPAAR